MLNLNHFIMRFRFLLLFLPFFLILASSRTPLKAVQNRLSCMAAGWGVYINRDAQERDHLSSVSYFVLCSILHSSSQETLRQFSRVPRKTVHGADHLFLWKGSAPSILPHSLIRSWMALYGAWLTPRRTMQTGISPSANWFTKLGKTMSVCIGSNTYTDSDPFISFLQLVILSDNATDFNNFGLNLVARHSFGYSGPTIRYCFEPGHIPDLSSLKFLETFGEIPLYLGNTSSLHELFLQNNLTGQVPRNLIGKPGLDLRTSGNRFSSSPAP